MGQPWHGKIGVSHLQKAEPILIKQQI